VNQVGESTTGRSTRTSKHQNNSSNIQEHFTSSKLINSSIKMRFQYFCGVIVTPPRHAALFQKTKKTNGNRKFPNFPSQEKKSI
jgi:hypothetical protein